jgi:hypothetical protein
MLSPLRKKTRLDPVKYGVFKTNMINGWTTGAFKPPHYRE